MVHRRDRGVWHTLLFFRSHRGDSNSGPTVYETVALARAFHEPPEFAQAPGAGRSILRVSKQHEENGLPDILMTMSQTPLPDVTRELNE